ncbi:feline leukemia virus subgroup C [Echinococcus multilocularis]|uniref:Feline leukemia virus subgroup C n=1 Tax=Echinococcus multilocularis TaxID=6211 RepID=A0A068YN50_ECHMU|nr:feline leukemia virus subgroup C [Echinococcus multilocularis]
MDSDSSVENQKRQADADSFEPVLFRKRWLMLFLFSSVSMLNAFQWLHINIVLPSAIFFWNSSLPSDQQGKDVAIAWLSMLYMLVYIPMIFPATWLLNHYGLRVSILIGAMLNMLGAWIKCLSMELSQPISSPASNASFPLLMVAQLVCALGQVFLLGVPAQLAATWFSKSELAMATAIGVFGNQVGCALGFGLPPLMVPAVTSSTGVGDFEDFRKGFRIMFYGGAAIMSFDLLLVAIFFKEEPEIAPSRAQYKRILQRRAQLAGDKPDEADFASAFDHESSVLTAEESVLVNQSYFHQVAHSFKCISFIYLNICYGVNTGVYYEIGTLLNSIVAEFFPTEQVAIGWIGFSMVIAGLVGSIVAGVVLKKTGLYRLVLIIFYFLSVISMGAFMGSLYSNLIGTVFLTMILLGFFQSGFLPLGFEYAAEITYPIDEGLTSGILNTSAHIFGIILTQVATAMIGNYGALPTNIFILVCMAIAGVPACFMKDDLKRQRAHEKMRVEVEANSGDEFQYSSISKTKDV